MPLLDGLGSMRQGLDQSSGRYTGQTDYSAFGQVIGGNNPGAFQSVYQWGAQSGYRMDGPSGSGGDAGLVKVGSRYYDPAVGRFTSRDSDISQAAYCYCNGDPINKTDPSGHKSALDTVLNWGLTFAGGLGTSFGAIQGLKPIGTTGATTTTASFSFLWGAASYSSTSTTTFASQIGMNAATKTGWIGAYVVGVAAASYGAYHLSDWFTSDTAPGRGMTNSLGRALFRLENL